MKELEDILELISENKMSVRQAAKLIRLNSISEIEGVAKLDTNRLLRTGIPEVIFSPGKNNSQLERIGENSKGVTVFSRLSSPQAEFLKERFRGTYNEQARAFVIGKLIKKGGTVGIISAGTSDIPVAEESRVMAEVMGCQTIVSYDAGVAGIHRLFPILKKMIGKADAIIVIAGREGTLPSIVAGLVEVPVIGVPTSIGYGYGGNGEAALKSMLQSCSFIVTVNIDNGIGAGAFAALIARKSRGSK
ncbi:MAG: nickel pincer cofactor biosynthesis protein LarB [Candidatus Micrarchaeota archaeon]